MTFGKVVASVFFGSMVLGVASTTKPQPQNSDRQAVAVLERPSVSGNSCQTLAMNMRETSNELAGISSRAFDNANAVRDFVRNRDIALLRRIVRLGREDVSAARELMVRASSQLDKAIRYGCSTEAQAADARQKLARLSDVEDQTLSYLNDFQGMLDNSPS